MSSLFSLYREVLPPSVVTHAVAASLVAPGAKNLVVAKSCVLEIYNVVEADEEAPDASALNDAAGDAPRRARKAARLELLAHRKLHGVISSIGVVRTAVGAGAEDRDSLLLSFADAKVGLSFFRSSSPKSA